VFWTGITRKGCAGQFTSCADREDKTFNRLTVISTLTDGGCAVVASTLGSDQIFKSMPCDSLYNVACIANKGLPFSLPQKQVTKNMPFANGLLNLCFHTEKTSSPSSILFKLLLFARFKFLEKLITSTHFVFAAINLAEPVPKKVLPKALLSIYNFEIHRKLLSRCRCR